MVDPVLNMGGGDDPLPDVDHEPEVVQSHEAQFVPPIRINLQPQVQPEPDVVQ